MQSAENRVGVDTAGSELGARMARPDPANDAFSTRYNQHKKIAEATQELHLEKCNHCRRILASTVPNYIQPRPVIVPWSSLYRARLDA